MFKARRRGKHQRGGLPDLARAQAVAQEMVRLAWRLRKEAVRQKEDEDGGFEEGLLTWSVRMVEMVGLAAAAGNAQADDLRGLLSALLYPEAAGAAASPPISEL